MSRFLTWLTPSSDQLHLWNYFWALKPMIDLQAKQWAESDFFLFLSNLHALTKDNRDPSAIKQNSLNLIKLYLASGIDPDKFFIYRQSDVSAHTDLLWIFQCLTTMWFMERMHVYKDALAKGNANMLSVWAFAYPILMAVDIILYDVDFVPVGKDQKQHVEYARDITDKFNQQFGDTFKLPEPYIQENVATIPGIDGRKMSKSYNNYIGLLDSEAEITKKIKKIPTAPIPIDDPKNPDEDNVYQIYKLFLSEDEDAQLRERYIAWGLSYKTVKDELLGKVLDFVRPIQEKFNQISDTDIESLLAQNALKANELAQAKRDEVYKLTGLL